MKINQNGDEQWRKLFGDIDRSEKGYKIIETSDGGLLLLCFSDNSLLLIKFIFNKSSPIIKSII